jgi:hypothetical protein
MLLNSINGLIRRTMMPKKPAAQTMPMIDQTATAIAKADGAHIRTNPARYWLLAMAALLPLARPTETMIDPIHKAVSFDDCWAVNSRMLRPNEDLPSGRDFRTAFWPIIRIKITGSSGK